jgi:hypothetical protein
MRRCEDKYRMLLLESSPITSIPEINLSFETPTRVNSNYGFSMLPSASTGGFEKHDGGNVFVLPSGKKKVYNLNINFRREKEKQEIQRLNKIL